MADETIEKIKEIMSDVKLNVYLDQCLDAEEVRKATHTISEVSIGWGKNAEIFAGYLDRIRNVLDEERKVNDGNKTDRNLELCPKCKIPMIEIEKNYKGERQFQCYVTGCLCLMTLSEPIEERKGE